MSRSGRVDGDLSAFARSQQRRRRVVGWTMVAVLLVPLVLEVLALLAR